MPVSAGAGPLTMYRILAFAFIAFSLSAQTCQITSTGTPPIRAEGLTERVGDIAIFCTGGTPVAAGAPLQTMSIQVSPAPGSPEITSRVLADGGFFRWSESLLLIDNPAVGAQYPCEDPGNSCPGFGNGTGQPTYYGAGPQSPGSPNNRNVFQGGYTGTPMTFIVPFDPPGPGATRILRIVNLRVNANQLGLSLGESRVVHLDVVSFFGSGGAARATVPVAVASLGLRASLLDAAGLTPIASIPWNDTGSSSPVRVATLRFEEGSDFSFRTRTTILSAIPGLEPPLGGGSDQNTPWLPAQNTESGFWNPSFPNVPGRGNLGLAGLADHGTRFMARFSRIPPGAQLLIDSYYFGGANFASFTPAGAFGNGPFVTQLPLATPFPLNIANGAAAAVWQVFSNQISGERLDFGVYAVYPPGTGRPNTEVRLDFAPGDVTGSAAIPRFAIQGGTTPPSSCTFQAAPPSSVVPVEDSSFRIRVNTQVGCEWRAVSSVPWLTSSGPVQGSGEVLLRAAFNPGPPRTAQVAIGTTSATVAQAGGAASLSAPTITAPNTNQTISVSGVTFAWNPVSTATHYDMRMFRIASSQLVYQGSIADASSILIDLPYGDLTNPQVQPRQFQFLVRACTSVPSDATCGPFGSVTFQSQPPQPPGRTQITAPVSNQVFTSSTVTFQWQAIPGVEFYRVLLRRGTGIVLQLRVPAGVTSTIYSMPAGNYSLNVQSCAVICDAFNNFVGSNVIDFRVDLPPIPAASPIVSQTSLSGNTLTASWNPVPGADMYRVQVVQPNTGPGGGALTVAAGQSAVTNIALPVPSGSASVFVAACNGNGCGPYSAPAVINPTVANPAGPVLGTPIPGTSVDGPFTLFTWSRIPGDNGSNTPYRLFVADLSRSTTAADVHTRDNFAAVLLASEGRRYDAVVAANPGPGQAIGPPNGFQVNGASPTAPTMVSPGHRSRVSQGNVQIGWTPVAGASAYQYFVAVRGQSSPTVTGVAPGLFVLAPLSAAGGATEYSAIVRACTGLNTGQPGFCAPNSDTGWGPWSNAPGGPGVTDFTVLP